MADLHKLTVQEALNAVGPGGKWDTQAVGTHVGTGTTNTIHVDVSSYHQLGNSVSVPVIKNIFEDIIFDRS